MTLELEKARQVFDETKQRHADKYLAMLMDETLTADQIRLEMPNIDVAISRFKLNEVTSSFAFDQLESRLKAVQGY